MKSRDVTKKIKLLQGLARPEYFGYHIYKLSNQIRTTQDAHKDQTDSSEEEDSQEEPTKKEVKPKKKGLRIGRRVKQVRRK